MAEYTIRDFLDIKALIAGVLIVISLIGLTFSISPLILDEEIALPSTPGSWDISTPSKAAASLKVNSENLLYAEVEVLKITEALPSWGGGLDDNFYKGIAKFTLFKQLQLVSEGEIITPNSQIWKKGSWQLNIIRIVGVDRVEKSDQVENIDGALVNQQLQTSLAADLEDLDSLLNITSNYSDEIDAAKTVSDIQYWKIDQIYDDGTYIKIRLFGETIYIQQTISIGLMRTENSFAIVFDSANPNPPSYKGETSANGLNNYENAINLLLQAILDSN